MAAAPSTVEIGAGWDMLCHGLFHVFPLIRLRGVSIATAATRLSVVIPILAAVLLWGEQPNGLQTTGALLALISLPLLAIKRPTARVKLCPSGRGCC
jgi:drug/metabolite transporter (DMT)-like permease